MKAIVYHGVYTGTATVINTLASNYKTVIGLSFPINEELQQFDDRFITVEAAKTLVGSLQELLKEVEEEQKSTFNKEE